VVTTTEPAPSAVPIPTVVDAESDDPVTGAATADVASIELLGETIAYAGDGASVSGSTITIVSAGTYSVSGVLRDGQIIVDTPDEKTVALILNGVSITSSTSAPIYIINAEKVVITLADGTESTVTDGDAYALTDAESGEPNAAIFSNDDLTIGGNGALVVNANYNHGIASDDDLKITGGTINVSSVNDALKGKDSIVIQDGTVMLNAGGDGMHASNTDDAGKGNVSIEGGTLVITAALDGIQAETQLLVSGGDITVSSGGGSVNASQRADWGTWGQGNSAVEPDAAISAKGLKAGVDLTIENGTITIDSSDDAIHSNDRMTVNGGTIVIASGDDGLHADATLLINGGELAITKSYEGIESAAITINDGAIRVVSSDDGINTAGGADGSALGGRPGRNTFSDSGDYSLTITGGYVAVDALGDGIDSNGPIDMSDGVVLINGPTGNMNGALDYMGSFTITGGLLVAAGSSGMAQAPSESSTQHSVIVNFPSVMAAGTLVHMEAAVGQGVLTFAPVKDYQSIVVSSPELANGETYAIYVGGSSTGVVADSLYTGGSYAAGTRVTDLTISSIVTGVGNYGGFMRGRPGGGRP